MRTLPMSSSITALSRKLYYIIQKVKILSNSHNIKLLGRTSVCRLYNFHKYTFVYYVFYLNKSSPVFMIN